MITTNTGKSSASTQQGKLSPVRNTTLKTYQGPHIFYSNNSRVKHLWLRLVCVPLWFSLQFAEITDCSFCCTSSRQLAFHPALASILHSSNSSTPSRLLSYRDNNLDFGTFFFFFFAISRYYAILTQNYSLNLPTQCIEDASASSKKTQSKISLLDIIKIHQPPSCSPSPAQ